MIDSCGTVHSYVLLNTIKSLICKNGRLRAHLHLKDKLLPAITFVHVKDIYMP